MGRQVAFPPIKVIEKGYMVEISSWENDGDNDKTVTLGGLSRNQALHINRIAEKFSKAHQEGYWGNLEWDSCFSDFEKYAKDSCDTLGLDAEEAGARGLLESGVIECWADGEYFRVVDSIKTYYVPEVIVLEEVEL